MFGDGRGEDPGDVFVAEAALNEDDGGVGAGSIGLTDTVDKAGAVEGGASGYMFRHRSHHGYMILINWGNGEFRGEGCVRIDTVKLRWGLV